jgi:carboxyl-terminal processing protease
MKAAIACALAVAPLWSADVADPGITVRDKLWIASKIYASIESRFGHWQAVAGLDLDTAYQRYLDEIAGTTSRRDFDLATFALMAQLRNGHSGFWDKWLFENNQPPGFYLWLERGQWVVRRSRRAGLEPGDVVVRIDGKPAGDFVSERMKYIAGSSELARRTGVFFFPPVWPLQFTLALADGRRVEIDRSQKPAAQEATPQQVHAPGGVEYLHIASFGDPKHEQDAIAFIKAHKDAPAIIFDVRGNGGGSTPGQLIRALMDRPWRDWIESTSALFPLFRTYGEIFSPKDAENDARGQGYLEAFAQYFNHPYLMLPPPLNQPENPIYTGRVIILADGSCGSACEDFVMPLKFSGRATVVGETTYGSSGQPYIYDFRNGMGFRVSTKRMYFPDGSEFEGVGIKPDVEIISTAADIKTARDPVLEKAIALARSR